MLHRNACACSVSFRDFMFLMPLFCDLVSMTLGRKMPLPAFYGSVIVTSLFAVLFFCTYLFFRSREWRRVGVITENSLILQNPSKIISNDCIFGVTSWADRILEVTTARNPGLSGKTGSIDFVFRAREERDGAVRVIEKMRTHLSASK